MNKEFLITIFLSNTQGASFQRGNVYAKNATDEQKKSFQEDFLKRLRELASSYTKQVSDKEHCDTIQRFADQLSLSHPNALANGRLRIGTAQKAVNLFLKFLWSTDFIPEPPHCPVDRIVLEELRDPRNWTQLDDIKKYQLAEVRDQNWTQLDDIKKYQVIIELIRTLAKGRSLSLSQWEDDLWRRKAQ